MDNAIRESKKIFPVIIEETDGNPTDIDFYSPYQKIELYDASDNRNLVFYIKSGVEVTDFVKTKFHKLLFLADYALDVDKKIILKSVEPLEKVLDKFTGAR